MLGASFPLAVTPVTLRGADAQLWAEALLQSVPQPPAAPIFGGAVTTMATTRAAFSAPPQARASELTATLLKLAERLPAPHNSRSPGTPVASAPLWTEATAAVSFAAATVAVANAAVLAAEAKVTAAEIAATQEQSATATRRTAGASDGSSDGGAALPGAAALPPARVRAIDAGVPRCGAARRSRDSAGDCGSPTSPLEQQQQEQQQSGPKRARALDEQPRSSGRGTGASRDVAAAGLLALACSPQPAAAAAQMQMDDDVAMTPPSAPGAASLGSARSLQRDARAQARAAASSGGGGSGAATGCNSPSLASPLPLLCAAPASMAFAAPSPMLAAAPPLRYDTACPYTAGTAKHACWTVLEPAGAAGLTTDAIVAAAAAAGLLGWSAAGRTPRNTVATALSQEKVNFARVAPCTYALRAALGDAAAGAPRDTRHVMAWSPLQQAEQEGGDASGEGTTAAAAPPPPPPPPGSLAALTLKELRAAFAAVCGRKTTSKNKGWLRNRLAERSFCGGSFIAAELLTSDDVAAAEEAEGGSAAEGDAAPHAHAAASMVAAPVEADCSGELSSPRHHLGVADAASC